MTETNNAPAAEEKTPVPAGTEEELRAELARVRGRNNTLRIVAAVLLSLFIILAAVAFLVYRKIAATKTAFEEAFQSLPPAADGYQPETRTLPFGPPVYSSTAMPASTLGLFAGGLPGGAAANFDPAQGEQIVNAMSKYADRPIVKTFLADLKRNPDMAAAFAASKGGNPVAVVSAVQRAKGMDKMIMQYAARPEFLKLLMEVMSDPDMKPLMKNLPAGLGMPSGMPQGAAVPVQLPSGFPPASSRPADENGDGELTFDPSVISGPAKPAAARSKKTPPPVDSGR